MCLKKETEICQNTFKQRTRRYHNNVTETPPKNHLTEVHLLLELFWSRGPTPEGQIGLQHCEGCEMEPKQKTCMSYIQNNELQPLTA